MESKPGRVWEPSGKRVGHHLAVFRVHCSPPMDSELGGAQVRLESETSSCGMGVGTSAIRRDIYNNGELAEWAIASVLKTEVLVRGPGVRIPHSPPKNVKE